MYVKKIVKISDRKLAEFNFKMIHDILPCNVNLVRWRKANDKQCRLCKVDETIVHLLYKCKYAHQIWCDFTKRTGTMIDSSDIILGVQLSDT